MKIKSSAPSVGGIQNGDYIMMDLVQLEVHKSELLACVEGWSRSRLNFHPASGGWSAAEVFDHLVKTEERILDMAKEGIVAPRRIMVTDRIRTAFLRKVFESERRVKVPASASVVLPDEVCEMAVICPRWEAVRSDLAAFQGQLSPSQMRQGIFKHPVGGWMALPDVVDFFYAHMTHHRFQLDRLSAETRSL